MGHSKEQSLLVPPVFITNKFEVSVIEDNIFRLKPFEDVELELEDAYEMRKIFVELSQGGKYGILIDGTNFFTVTPEMRKLTSNREYSSHRFATAFVTKLLANKLFGNLFLTFNMPTSPTRIFNKEQEALAWIRKHADLK
jgi:hypothetical protein